MSCGFAHWFVTGIVDQYIYPAIVVNGRLDDLVSLLAGIVVRHRFSACIFDFLDHDIGYRCICTRLSIESSTQVVYDNFGSARSEELRILLP